MVTAWPSTGQACAATWLVVIPRATAPSYWLSVLRALRPLPRYLKARQTPLPLPRAPHRPRSTHRAHRAAAAVPRAFRYPGHLSHPCHSSRTGRRRLVSAAPCPSTRQVPESTTKLLPFDKFRRTDIGHAAKPGRFTSVRTSGGGSRPTGRPRFLVLSGTPDRTAGNPSRSRRGN